MPRGDRGYRSDEELAQEAALLARGLEILTVHNPDYAVCLCGVCKGHGEHVQRYIEGRMRGTCDWCGGQGLAWRHAGIMTELSTGELVRVEPPGDSYLHQIYVAAGHNPDPGPGYRHYQPRRHR